MLSEKSCGIFYELQNYWYIYLVTDATLFLPTHLVPLVYRQYTSIRAFGNPENSQKLFFVYLTCIINKDKLSIKQRQKGKEFSVNDHIFNAEAKI